MAKGVLAVENVFNRVQHPLHAISANEEAEGAEAFRVGRGSRWYGPWTPTTANAEAWLQASFDRVRAFDFIAIDGHNLGGKTVKLRVSSDGFTTYEEIFSATVPAVSSGGAEALEFGAVTFDGAYLRQFDTRAGTAVRLVIPAMGAGLKPSICGLYVGLSWEPLEFFDRPFADVQSEVLIAGMARSPAGWRGGTLVAAPRRGVLELRLDDWWESDRAEPFAFHFARNRPAWLVFDAAHGERAVLAEVDAVAAVGPITASGWAYPRLSIPWTEREPRLA